jgi:hypothetical protein
MNPLNIAVPIILVIALFSLVSLAALIDPRDPALQPERLGPAHRPGVRQQLRPHVHLYPTVPAHAYVADSAHQGKQASEAHPKKVRDQVLIKVQAASVNTADLYFLKSDPFMLRFQAGLRQPKHQILGADIAGRV